jgi:ubiquinone/menaquinone biosynthesis C-methylase UbiE
VPSTPSSEFFGDRAADYDRLRPLTGTWWQLFERLVESADLRGRRILDVGCGTGRLAEALAERAASRVWGVDREPRMLAVARERVPANVGLKEGRAEALPFRDGWFERVVFWLSIHLVDRAAALTEAGRVLVPDGRLALVTFAPEHFAQHWAAPYFPSLERVDRARFPTPDALREELPDAGFAEPQFVPLTEQAEMNRETALDRIRKRHISTFALLDPEEVRIGTEQAERELPETITWEQHWLLVIADRATG